MSCKHILNLKRFICDNLMKREWLTANVTAVWPPTRAVGEVFGLYCTFFGQVGPLLWSGRHFVSYKTHLKNITYDYLMKREWLIVNVTAVGPLTRAAHKMFWRCLAFCGQVWPLLWSGSTFVI